MEISSDGNEAVKDKYKFSSLVIEYNINQFMTKNGKRDYLGCGSFGAVRRCSHENIGVIVVKCFRLTGTKEQQKKLLKSVFREANILASLHHDNIVQMLGIVRWDPCIGIVMEYVEGGTLSDLLFNKDIKEIAWPVLLRIFHHIVSVLELLHNYSFKKEVCHGDLKTENVLLTRDLSAKVADFGSANIVKATGASAMSYELAPTTQHTQWYAAPELLADVSRERTPAMDMYSLAMIMFEMAARRQVYHGANAPYYIIINGIQCGILRPELSWLNDVQITASQNTVDSQIFHFLYEQMILCWDKNPTIRATSGQLFALSKDLLKKCDGSKMFLERKKLWKQMQSLKGRDKTDDDDEEKIPQTEICLNEFSYPFLSAGSQTALSPTSNKSRSIKPEHLSGISVPKNAKEEEKYATTIRDCLNQLENDEDFERILKISEAVSLRLRVHLPIRLHDEIAHKCLEVAAALAQKVYYERACEFIEFGFAMYNGISKNGEKRIEFTMNGFAVCHYMAKTGIKYLKEEFTRSHVFPLTQQVLARFDEIQYAELDDVLLARVQCWVRCLVIWLKYDDLNLATVAAREVIMALLEGYDEDERLGTDITVKALLEKLDRKLVKYGARQFFRDALLGYQDTAQDTALLKAKIASINAKLQKVQHLDEEKIEEILLAQQEESTQTRRPKPTLERYKIPNLSEDMQMAAAIQASLQQSEREKYLKDIIAGVPRGDTTPTEEQHLLKFFDEVERRPEETDQTSQATVEQDLSSLSDDEMLKRAIAESLRLNQPSPHKGVELVEAPSNQTQVSGVVESNETSEDLVTDLPPSRELVQGEQTRFTAEEEEELTKRAIDESLRISQLFPNPETLKSVEMPENALLAGDSGNTSDGVHQKTEDQETLLVAKEVVEHLVKMVGTDVTDHEDSSRNLPLVSHPNGVFTSP